MPVVSAFFPREWHSQAQLKLEQSRHFFRPSGSPFWRQAALNFTTLLPLPYPPGRAPFVISDNLQATSLFKFPIAAAVTEGVTLYCAAMSSK
ncbi:MAG: hypothetical protein WCA27_30050 [Candidatus Sulfotelmatobacter sp.]